MLLKSTIQWLGISIPLLGILLIAAENKPEKSSGEPVTAKADASNLPVDIIIAQE